MSIRALAIAVAASVAFGSVASSQPIFGTYTAPNQQGGTVTLVLQSQGGGKVGGTLSGNGNTFQIEGTLNNELAEGTISGTGMKMFFGAQLRSADELQFLMVEPDASGQPNYQRATPLSFKRGASTPAAPSAAGGNPLGSNRASSANDRYSGAWTSKDVQLTISGGGGGYTGTLVHQGQSYPVTLKDEGPGLSGHFTAGGASYELLVKAENSSLLLNTAGTTYMLARANAGGGNALSGPGGGGAGRSPQDEQMFRVLTANGWCSFSYSGSSGSYSSGGVSRTSKVFLRADGTVSSTSNSERTSSGASGQVYVGGSGGAQGYWKFEGGQLYLGPSLQQLTPQQFKMTYNSNGSPIPVVNGTEYMICR